MKKFTRVPTVCALLWLKLFIISFNLHYWFFFFLWCLCPKLIFGNFFLQEATVVEGSFEAVENAENDSSVNEVT